MHQKVLSMILVLVMLLGLLSVSAFTVKDTTSSDSADTSYEYNIMFLDCGRKYYSVDSIKKIINNASAAGFNYIQLAVGNDGLRFLLDDMLLTVNGTTYDSKDVKSAIQAGNKTYNAIFGKKGNEAEDSGELRPYNPSVNELTQSEMNTIIAYAKTKGMGVIPCVNTPGHMDAILSAATSLTGTNCSYNGSVRTIDVTNDTAVAFTQALLKKYITYFAGQGCKLFNMGADEYANDIYTGGSMGFGNLQESGNYRHYVNYVNDVAAMIKHAGMKPMAFNDGIYFKNNTSSGTFDTDIIVCYWSSGWGNDYKPMSAANLAGKGFKLINTHGDYYWVLGKNAKCSAETASNFNTTAFYGSTVSNPAGSMFCIWADYPGAETEESVITKTAATIRAFGAALPKVTSGTVTPTPTTPTKPETDAANNEYTISVGSSKTITVSGNYAGNYQMNPANVAAVTTKHQQGAASSISYSATASASIQAYWAPDSPASNVIDGDTSTMYWSSSGQTKGAYVQVDLGAAIPFDTVRLTSPSGTEDYCTNADVLVSEDGNNWTKIGSYTGNTSTPTAFTNTLDKVRYIKVAVTVEKENWWQLSEIEWGNTVNGSFTRMPASGTVTTEAKDETAITFTGLSVGDATVEIGGVTYTIHVTAEDLNNVTPLTIEYWITNGRVKSDANSSTTAASVSATDDGIATETGKNVSGLVPSKGIKVDGGREVDYWRCRMLDTTLANSSTSKTEKQTEKGGDDETVSGIGFTKIRYYGGNWQVFTENNAWVTVDTVNNQLVAYYLENIKVSDEVDSFAADWGNRGDGSSGGWLDTSNYCTLSMQVVYEDGTTNPTGTAAKDLKSKTIVYGYWSDNNGRGIGTVLLEGQEYEIYKVTSETGAATASFSGYNAKVTNFTWDKNETTVWQGEPSSSVSIHNDATGFSSEGVNANLCWDENKEAILLRVYVRAKVTEDSLTVNYFDENNTSLPFYSYNIAVASGTTFNDGFAYSNGALINNTVENIKGVTQTVNWQLEKMPEIGAQYRFGNYTFTSATKETGNKVVNLYYRFNSEKTFVVDFGLPLHITKTDISLKLSQANIEGVTVGNSLYATVSANDDYSIDYILNKTIDGSDRITVTYTGTKTSGESDSATYNLTIIPASTVYYEDNFVSFSDGWTEAGTTETNAVQHLDELGKTGANNYGYDAKYNKSSEFSLGSAMKTTVSSTTNSNPPTATFTFKGTGFDLVSMTSKDTGTILVDVNGMTENNKTVTKHWIVDTFYGYTRQEQGVIEYTWTKGSDGTWHNKAVVKDTLPEGATIGGTPMNSDDKTYEPNYIWTPAGEGDNALYQIPVIHYTDLPYGTYTVTVTPKYSSKRDPYYQADGNNNSYDFYLDGVRIYNPAGDKLNSQYVNDGEGYAQFTEIRNMLLDASDLTANIQSTTGMVFVDGVGTNGQLADYTNHGPNNEVYLSRNQAIAFKIIDMSNVDSIQIGAKAPNGDTTMQIRVGTNESQTQTQQLTTASDMYYKLDNVQPGQTIVITNAGDNLLSLTTLKVTYKADPSASNSADPVVDEEVVAQAPVMLMSMLYGEPQTFEPEHFTAKWSRNVRKGGTATLTVKASADVESITVNGEKITAYTTKTERSFWGPKETYHVFTYRVTNATTADYTVCALNAEGVASDPITAPLTVRPSIRDWWHGIFDKWF